MDERLLFVEFRPDGSPFAVETSRTGYDVEVSRRDGYLVKSGGGTGIVGGRILENGKVVSTPWWSVDGTLPKGITRQFPEYRLVALPYPWTEAAILELLAQSECTDPVYCSICDDWLDGESSLTPCRHVWWCENGMNWDDNEDDVEDGCNWWTGPGYEDPCPHIRRISLLGDGHYITLSA